MSKDVYVLTEPDSNEPFAAFTSEDELYEFLEMSDHADDFIIQVFDDQAELKYTLQP